MGPEQDLSHGVAVEAGLLWCYAGSPSWLAASLPVFCSASCQASFLQQLMLLGGWAAGEVDVLSPRPLLHRESCLLTSSQTRPVKVKGMHGAGRGAPLLLLL